jgi:uncharacterized membrane protein YcaP (DUF421 family)
METILTTLHAAFSDQIGGKELSAGAMAIRAVFVFVAWLILVRFADRRMLGRYSAFDTVLGVMIGALLGRTINGGASLWGTMLAVTAIIAVHWLLAFLTHRSHAWGKLIKGTAQELVTDGKVNRKAMKKNLITENDLEEMLRLHTQIATPAEAKVAVLERNGQISSIPFRKG